MILTIFVLKSYSNKVIRFSKVVYSLICKSIFIDSKTDFRKCVKQSFENMLYDKISKMYKTNFRKCVKQNLENMLYDKVSKMCITNFRKCVKQYENQFECKYEICVLCKKIFVDLLNFWLIKYIEFNKIDVYIKTLDVFIEIVDVFIITLDVFIKSIDVYIDNLYFNASINNVVIDVFYFMLFSWKKTFTTNAIKKFLIDVSHAIKRM